MMEATSLATAIAAIDDSSRHLTVCNRTGEREEAWPRVGERARRLAAELQARGLNPGDPTVVVGEVSVEIVEVIVAVILSGAAVSVISPGARQRRGGLAAEVARRTRQISARVVLIDGPAGDVDAAVGQGVAVWTVDDVALGGRLRAPTAFEEVDVDPASTAVLQFTSGVTGEPRVVRVSHRNITSYFAALDQATRFDPAHETLVSWLPLMHDMGLIGYLFGALVSGAELFLAAPDLFIVRPDLWLSWVARFPSVHSAAPSFAYGLLARSPRLASDLDLASWRFAFNGGEQINSTDVERFCTRMGPAGFRRASLVCSYGLAEATLAVTAALDGTGPAWDLVDRDALATDGVADATVTASTRKETLARLGRPLSCVEVRIVDRRTGGVLPERHVGEIQVSGSSVTDGYAGSSALQEGLFDGPWLRTGDRGYLAEGQLVACGRWKDLIVMGGRNIAPQQVETAAERHAQLRPGSVAAIGVPSAKGTEKLVLVASVPTRLHTNALARGLVDAVHHELGVTTGDVVFVAPGAIPRTASGKPQRHVCRQQYLDGTLRAGGTGP